ncbi:nucleotidyltransferase domain-containing protein [Kitasatospora cinereorecta]
MAAAARVHTDRMPDEATEQLLTRFVDALGSAVPLVALWAHGSLAGGDYRPGRSDLDLIAVLARPCTPAEQERLSGLHERLVRTDPLGAQLHCGYPAVAELDDPARPHPAWAHQELLRRPITPVTRRELHEFGRVRYGQPPAGLLPPVTADQLAAFVVEDLAGFWRPALDHPEWWLREIWIDLGLLTLARAGTTLRTGRLITKAEALDVLTGAGAPAELVEDIRQRRYGDPRPASDAWRRRRAELTRGYLGPAIDKLVAEHRAGGS